MAGRQGTEPQLRLGLAVAAGVGLVTGLVEGPVSVLATGSPFFVLDTLRAHGHHALMVGLIAAHNLGVAATMPALGGWLAPRTPAATRGRALGLLFVAGVATLGLTALLVRPSLATVPLFVAEAIAVLALGVPVWRRLATGRGAVAPWCGLAALLAVVAAAAEVRLVA